MARMPKKLIPELVDRAGELKAEIAEREEELARIKDRLFSQFGAGSYDGKLYHLTLSAVTTQRLSSSKAQQYLTPKEIEACTEVSESLQMRVYARTRDG